MNPRLFRLGDAGPEVSQIGSLLERLGLLQQPGSSYDEAFERAVRAFQQQRGLSVDGIVGGDTFRALDEARWTLGDRLLTHLPGSPLTGDDVFALQRRLLDLGFRVGRVDGIFGPATETGVRDFQRNVGIPPDGTCGPATLKALSRLTPKVSGGAPNRLRAQERIRDAGPQLVGKVVVIDPVGLTDPDRFTPDELAMAADVVHDLATRVEGRLVATGVQAFLTRPRMRAVRDDEDATVQPPMTQAERAAFANRTQANLSLSLQVDASDSPDASGVATYFFGSSTHDTWSSSGERFAGLVQREIVARTDLVDLRTHAKTWDFLRRTRMPAVRVDLGYVTNAADARRLSDPGFRDVLAEAIVVAVKRFYLSPESDAKTGVLRFSELREALRGS